MFCEVCKNAFRPLVFPNIVVHVVPDLKQQDRICKHIILKAKSNSTLLLFIPFLGIGEWYFKCF